jgi:tetratricopeptide (TPR) repeat protein
MFADDEVKRPVTVFLSYAQEDELLLKKLEAHLSLLKHQGLISTWYHQQIIPGMGRIQEIDRQLENASIILLLISADFLASQYCYGTEMQHALQLHAANKACVVPIIIRSCDYSRAPFAQLKSLPGNGKPITLWDNQDVAWTDVAMGIRRIIEDLSELSTPSQPLLFASNIPYTQNPFFTGHDITLSYLHTQLRAGQVTALSQPQAISGLGGIGKTQIAVEYAYRYRRYYQAVLWARADTRESLVSGYITIARLLRLPQKDDQNQTLVVNAVLQWLKIQTQWLLILDNADDLAIVHDFLPSVSSGHILLTTRAQATGKIAQRLEIDTMDRDIGALLLLRRASLVAHMAALEAASYADLVTAREISEALGGLPLALDQAGAYIEETGCGLATYSDLYRTRSKELLERRSILPTDHPEPVATTWSLSLQKIEKVNPASVALLYLFAFLHPDMIPAEIISTRTDLLDPQLATIASDTFKFNEAIEKIRAFSLINRNLQTKSFSIHRLVQAVLKDSMTHEIQSMWAERAIKAVNSVFPTLTATTWHQCMRYLPQIQICVGLIEEFGFSFHEAARLLDQFGYYLTEVAYYFQAEPLYLRALAIREISLGAEHADTATSLGHLALLYFTQSKYAQAEPFYLRALAIYEKVSGLEHTNTATILNNLALLYFTQGKYPQAESLYLRALTICEKIPDQEDSAIVVTLNNLARLYFTQGKYSQAESLYHRALKFDEKRLELYPPDTATILNNLARLYFTQGKYLQAESLYLHALEISEKFRDPEHPDIATILTDLGRLYLTQGKYREAEPLYLRALVIREKRLEPEHPETGTTLNHLARLYRIQGKYTQAEMYYLRVLTIYEKALGSEHSDTATILNNLARLYFTLNKYAQAEMLYLRALAVYEKIKGSEHPNTATILNNLARLYFTQERYGEAEPLYLRALKIREARLGNEHLETATSLYYLASLYAVQGRYDPAESLYRRALEIREVRLGNEHLDLVPVLESYIELLYKTERKVIAQKLELHVQSIQAKNGYDH